MVSRGKAEPKDTQTQTRRNSEKEAAQPKPLLFISHKHADSEIAGVLNKYFSDWGDNRIQIFQTSAKGKGLAIGKNLNESLLDKLVKAEVLLLVYTKPDEDWSYCMWEAGVALDPKVPKNTHTVVVFCCAETPTVFKEDVMVDMREKDQVYSLVKQFLTKKDFFPSLSGALSGHPPDSDFIRDRANQLFDELKEVLPPLEVEESKDWPAWPMIIFELYDAHLDRIGEPGNNEESKEIEKVMQYCRIRNADDFAAKLFGKRSLEDIHNLEQLIDDWQGKVDGYPVSWAESICRQIIKAAANDFPAPDWRPFCDVDRERWYVPILFHVHIVPAERCRRFVVYFPRFQGDESGESLTIRLSTVGEKEP